jgi:predicted Mrr-cat superfamily restriction endonuclease
MSRYWVIAPVEAKNPQLFDNVWKFDLANNLISIGWSELGDISEMSREALSEAVAAAYPDRAKGLISNMLWVFYHEIGPGDFVIARRGRKILVAVGKVVRAGFYAEGRNRSLAPPGYSHPNFLEIEWQAQPRDISFPSIVFPMQTLTEITEVQYKELVGGLVPPPEPPPEVTDRNAFVLKNIRRLYRQ